MAVLGMWELIMISIKMTTGGVSMERHVDTTCLTQTLCVRQKGNNQRLRVIS